MGNIFAIAKTAWKEVYRKKDFYAFFILLVILLLILLNETFFEMPGISRFLKDIGFSFLWLFSLIIAITFSARQLPNELTTLTIHPLLAKPISRWQMLLGKFLASSLAAIFSFTVFYIVFLLTSYFKGEGVAPVLLFQSYLFGILFLSIVSAVSIFFSTFMTLSANVTISVLLYFFMSWFGESLRIQILSPRKIFAFLANFLYQILPHYELYDLRMRIVHGWEELPFRVVSMVFIYTLVYLSFILTLAYLKIRKKSL